MIANAVADHGQTQRGAAVEKTGRKASKSAVAETRVLFAFVDILEVQAETRQGLGRLVLDAEV